MREIGHMYRMCGGKCRAHVSHGMARAAPEMEITICGGQLLIYGCVGNKVLNVCRCQNCHLMLSIRARPEQRSFWSLSRFTTVSGSKDIETFFDFFFSYRTDQKVCFDLFRATKHPRAKAKLRFLFPRDELCSNKCLKYKRCIYCFNCFQLQIKHKWYVQYAAPTHHKPVNTGCCVKPVFLGAGGVCTRRSFHTALCLPFQKPFESSIFSKISCLLGATGKHCSETSSFARAICFIHHTDPQPRMRKRKRVSPHLL